MAVYCSHCGTGMSESARFCSNCGAAFSVGQPISGRPLIRPRVGRQIAGVCLGLARTNGWDVAVVRVVAILALVFTSGLVGIAYLAAWVGIPEEPLEQPKAYPPAI
jgi:phage shock protein C